MKEEVNVKWQYSDSIVREGNDCLITRVATIMEVSYNYYIVYVVTCSTIVNGWNGLDTNSQSFVYTSFEEARNYCDHYLMTY